MTPYSLYLFIMAVRRFSYTTGYTLFAVYLLEVVGTNPFELVLPGFFYELSIFLFEIPTGVVADVYSRRLSVIIGYAFMGAGFIIAGLIPSLFIVTLGLTVLGIGSTFVSGALSAWLVDEVGQERASRSFMRGAQVTTIARLAGIFVSIILGSMNLQLAIMGAGIPMLATSLLLIFIMPETGFQAVPAHQRKSWRALFATFQHGLNFVRTSRILPAMFIVILVFAGYGETFGKLWQAHVLANFTLPGSWHISEIVWFGIIGVVSVPLILLATERLQKRLNPIDGHTVTKLLNGLLVTLSISGLLFTLSSNFILALAGIWATQFIMALIPPLMEIWLNQHLELRIRATVLSIVGQVNSLGEILVGGPVAGIIATLFAVRAAIGMAALALLPLYLVVRAISRVEAQHTNE